MGGYRSPFRLGYSSRWRWFHLNGSNDVLGPFSSTVQYSTPSATAGAIVLKTVSAKDGNTSEASVIRVNFSS